MQRARLISLGLAITLMAAALGIYNLPLTAGFVILVGLVWLLGQRQEWPGVATFGLLCLIGAAIVGNRWGVPGPWLLAGAAAALMAWDIDGFEHGLRVAERDGWRIDAPEALR